ncbi:hypothetical protein CEXT_140991 [Caerostris extrusa]|uniref:Uncharacterized protein n=1 Tax=Caerostris extrusa TaxID=172846 RepID=A0AAV4QLN1_CAEEX|nr:hypothetical protein CEXT_140991 [Caerostris extrusa]
MINPLTLFKAYFNRQPVSDLADINCSFPDEWANISLEKKRAKNAENEEDIRFESPVDKRERGGHLVRLRRFFFYSYSAFFLSLLHTRLFRIHSQ